MTRLKNGSSVEGPAVSLPYLSIEASSITNVAEDGAVDGPVSLLGSSDIKAFEETE